MPGVGVEVTIDDSPFRAALLRLRALGSDLSPAMRAVGAAMVTSTKLRFTRGVGPGGAAWKPSQRVKRHGGQTLILSTRLMMSIVANASANLVEWGTNVRYGRIHQLGGTIERQPHTHTIYQRAGADGIDQRFVKKSKSNFARDVAVKAYKIAIPARPYLGIDAADQVEVTGILKRHVAAAITGTAP